ncbi:ETC complex I subunit conserved region-domain-containing protein [Syncephalastrum racemosum]|uniref:NADH dehydrogenase [ubiquinone] iron-sulfur protein 4, mitochondrial n=1 Tax=Syncephalastrum racemosum TaxID=13706 RepID=A0A1X2HIR2_SYNRA|nr:ETC complex I subunit conserved region-domain-containing protein [Syncephalastrum racemosum]
MSSAIARSLRTSRTWSVAARRFASTEAAPSSNQVTRADQHNAAVDVVSGAPEALTLERTVRIFSPAKPATQSGKNNTRYWRIEFDIMEDGNRWENPLIGWASSSDYQQSLAMKFWSKEAAIGFAEKQGWNYYVQEPKAVKFVKKAYADNYKYSAGPLRMIKTK